MHKWQARWHAFLAAFRRHGVIRLCQRFLENRKREHSYRTWYLAHGPTPQELSEQRTQQDSFSCRPLISILVPVYNTPPSLLDACVESVLAQSYPHWELLLADDASSLPETIAALTRWAEEPRVRVLPAETNGGISAASNRALSEAQGEFCALLDHDDILSPDALFCFVEVLQNEPTTDWLYSDEDKLKADGKRCKPFFKPGWSPELLLGMNYICHLSMIRTSLLRSCGGFRFSFDGAQDYDLFLRLSEQTDRVVHVPRVLYHWRMAEGSTAGDVSAKGSAPAQRREEALREAIQRRGWYADVSTDSLDGTHRVSFAPSCETNDCIRWSTTPVETIAPLPGVPESVDVVNLCEEDAALTACIQKAVEASSADALVLIQDAVQPVSADWLPHLSGLLQISQVGCIAGLLKDPAGRTVHDGVVWGASKDPDRCGLPDYFYTPRLLHNCMAVLPHIVLVRRVAWKAAGGLNTTLPWRLAFLDLCCRMHDAGWRIVAAPNPVFSLAKDCSTSLLYPTSEEWRSLCALHPDVPVPDKYHPSLLAPYAPDIPLVMEP